MSNTLSSSISPPSSAAGGGRVQPERSSGASSALPGAAEAAISDPLVAQLIEIEDRIAAAVPISAAGAVVQITRLREYAQDFDWCEHHDQFVDNLIAGGRTARRGWGAVIALARLALAAALIVASGWLTRLARRALPAP